MMGYPNITTAKELGESLYYLIPKEKFEKINTSKDIKLNSELFWLSLGDENDIRKALARLKTYYKRIEHANKSFSSIVEGWKTDRGKIYALFGHPSLIEVGKNYETWIYGYDNDFIPFRFKFLRIEKNSNFNNFFSTKIKRSSI